MSFYREKIVYIKDYKEFNEHLAFCEKERFRLYDDNIGAISAFKAVYGSLKWSWYLKVGLVKIELKYTKNIARGDYTTYVFFLDDYVRDIHIQGMQAFINLQRLSNKGVIDLSNNREYYNERNECILPTIAGLLYINPKFFGKRYSNCTGYDINSSYSWGMLQDIPDTRYRPRKFTELKKGEIGFRVIAKQYSDNLIFHATKKKGAYVDYAFPIIKSPFGKFVEYYYDKKMKAKTHEERQKNKDILNFAVGYIRRKNPFVHSAILSSVIDRMETLIDENTIYSNTDNIISRTTRNDLPLGNNIGEFKIEHTGDFVYSKSGYQWNKELPSIRGKSRAWFKKDFDILKDPLPHTEANKYRYNELKNRIELNK